MDSCHLTNSLLSVRNKPCPTSVPILDESDDSSVTLFSNFPNPEKHDSNGESPWLSKPRRYEYHLPLSEMSNNNRFESLPNLKSTPKRNFNFNTEKNNKFKLIQLSKIKVSLENLDLKPTSVQWETICDLLHVKSGDDIVILDDCVKVLAQVFETEIYLKSIALDEIISCLQYDIDSKQMVFQHKMLKNENKELRYQIRMLKQLLKEERIASCDTERELYSTRKKIQMLVNDKRQIEADLSQLSSKQNDEKLKRKSEESQTDFIPFEKKNFKKLEVTSRLYQISTDKLLQFTKVVYDSLSQYESSLPTQSRVDIEKTEGNLARKPFRIKRAASVQNITADVNNYIVRKHGPVAGVCCAASVCTGLLNVNSTGSENVDILERLANKAKEISTTIEKILSENGISNDQQKRVEWV